METWILMFICNLLCPVIMVVFGWIFVKHPPEKINNFYGYRTELSMKNDENWKFAHKYCGQIWQKVGAVMLIVTIIFMLLLIKYNADVIAIIGSVICIVQCVVIISTIYFVEKALKERVDN